jgi:hypothetical protein
MTFTQWMTAVDAALDDRLGVRADDLPDLCYRDLYDAGYTPHEAAQAALDNAADS